MNPHSCALRPIFFFFALLAGLTALRAANRRQIRETLEKLRSRAQLFKRFCALGTRRSFFPAWENRSPVWAHTRNQPRACAAGQKHKLGARIARRSRGLFPCPGKQEPGVGLHSKRTACVRDAGKKKTQCASCPAQPRAFSLPGKTEAQRGLAPGKNRVRARLKYRYKHGARLARRSRACVRGCFLLSFAFSCLAFASQNSFHLSLRPRRASTFFRKESRQRFARGRGSAPFEPPFQRPAAVLSFFRAAGRLSGPSGRKPPADKGNA